MVFTDERCARRLSRLNLPRGNGGGAFRTVSIPHLGAIGSMLVEDTTAPRKRRHTATGTDSYRFAHTLNQQAAVLTGEVDGVTHPPRPFTGLAFAGGSPTSDLVDGMAAAGRLGYAAPLDARHG